MGPRADLQFLERPCEHFRSAKATLAESSRPAAQQWTCTERGNLGAAWRSGQAWVNLGLENIGGSLDPTSLEDELVFVVQGIYFGCQMDGSIYIYTYIYIYIYIYTNIYK